MAAKSTRPSEYSTEYSPLFLRVVGKKFEDLLNNGCSAKVLRAVRMRQQMFNNGLRVVCNSCAKMIPLERVKNSPLIGNCVKCKRRNEVHEEEFENNSGNSSERGREDWESAIDFESLTADNSAFGLLSPAVKAVFPNRQESTFVLISPLNGNKPFFICNGSFAEDSLMVSPGVTTVSPDIEKGEETTAITLNKSSFMVYRELKIGISSIIVRQDMWAISFFFVLNLSTKV